MNLKDRHIILRSSSAELKLRRSLFWDMPNGGVDPEKNKRLIIERILSRGNIEEFKQMINYYSEEEIRGSVTQIGALDKKTYNFVSKLYKLKPADFRCFKGKLSAEKY
ncbi:MAG: hypothetical protein ABFS10_13165 [Bacteroidota bacterium]